MLNSGSTISSRSVRSSSFVPFRPPSGLTLFPSQRLDGVLPRGTDGAGLQAALLPGWAECNPVRQTVLACMVFNMGLTRVLGFKQMLDAVRRNDWPRAADEMLSSQWAGQVGARANRLANMMRYGVPINR